jgi:hypothetical protein
LLGNPIPRWQVVVGNFVATAVSTLGITAILGLCTWGAAMLLDVDLSVGRTAEAVLNLWPLCIFFGGLAMLCSALLRLLLLRFGHRGRHRLDQLRRPITGHLGAGPPGGVRLWTARHLYVAIQHFS